MPMWPVPTAPAAERAAQLQEAADAFAAEHPARWVDQLAARIDAGARTGFYPALARIACVMLGA